jgi:predicted ester cyclase
VATEAQTAESVEQLARDYFARVAARDPDGMMEFWVPGKGADIHGIAKLVAPDSYRAWFQNFFAAVPDLRFEVEEVVADGSRAAVRWRARGTFNGTGQLEGFDPNGMELARQLGAMPPQGSRAEKAMAGAFNLKTKIARTLRRA